MIEYLSSVLHHIIDWPIWQQFRLIQAEPPTTGSIFGFAEYLASLALFLVVMAASDFRFRYRLALTKTDLRIVGFWVGSIVGVFILVIDFWYENGFPIPMFIANANNLKAVLALIFLTFVFHVIWVTVVRPPLFTKANAKRFFNVNHYFIHEGNTDRLHTIAEELRASIARIIALAANAPRARNETGKEKILREHDYAADFLLLIGDPRFCQVVVDKVPAFALFCFQNAQRYPKRSLPIYQFVRNIGQEFIRNTNSSFYQEASGYRSGFFGYTKPVTSIVFGSYEFIEKCATAGGSPLETDYRDLSEFNSTQMEGFSRASLAFLENYLKETKGRSYLHSYALVRMLYSFESSLSGVHQLRGMEDYHKAAAYGRLTATVDFIKEAIKLTDKHAQRPSMFRTSDDRYEDIFDRLARLIYDTILAASAVSSPVWTAWSIQHNAVWGKIFGHIDSEANKIIAFKVRRLLYDTIMRMDEYANFEGARILGYCLNVLGLKLTDRHKGFRKEFYPLQASVISWTKANYKRLLTDHPKVAEACLQGSVSYDADEHRLVKSYLRETGKEPARDYLDLD